MNKKDFETYLYVEKTKFIIFLFDNINCKELYKNEILIENSLSINFENLSKFLDDNILQIEKLIGKFIENIYLIIDSDDEYETNICIMKKNLNNVTNYKNLNQAFVDVKNLFNYNYHNQSITHMTISEYIIDKRNYDLFIDNLKSDYICLNVKFLSLSTKIVSKFDKVLSKYQIQISQFMSAKYIRNVEMNKDGEFFQIAHEIRNGLNPNEIRIVPKAIDNKGFFEKFFQLFS